MEARDPVGSRHPFWVFAAFALLAIAFALAVANGRVVEAVLLGVLTLPPLAFTIGWVRNRVGDARRRDPRKARRL